MLSNCAEGTLDVPGVCFVKHCRTTLYRGDLIHETYSTHYDSAANCQMAGAVVAPRHEKSRRHADSGHLLLNGTSQSASFRIVAVIRRQSRRIRAAGLVTHYRIRTQLIWCMIIGVTGTGGFQKDPLRT